MYKILAIDDEEQNLTMVEYALKERYEVIPVKSGRMALKYLEGNTPDLILLDIWMPEMNGLEIYEKIRELEKCREVPVIFLTSANDAQTEEKCFDMGAFDFISKPFTPAIVLRRIDRTLQILHREQHHSRMGSISFNGNMEMDSERTIELNVNGMVIRVYQKDISYVEVYNNICLIHTNTREIAIRETLEHMTDRLGDGFIRTGRSYLLNVSEIAQIDDDVVTMKNGKKIKLPRRNKKELAQEIMKSLYTQSN